MLIVACPKSASTTIMHTMSYMLGVGGLHKKIVKRNAVSDYPTMCSYHSDMTNYGKKKLDGLIGSDRWIYKLHIPPTEHNLKNFEEINKKFVLLLRSPEGVLASYTRQLNAMPPERLLDEIKTWERRWLEFAERTDIPTIVTYEEFCIKPKNVTSAIRKTFGAKQVRKKLRVFNGSNYTGVGEVSVRKRYDGTKKISKLVDGVLREIRC